MSDDFVLFTRPVVKTRKLCCTGSFGEVDINGCNGGIVYKTI
jgi:hypothetical protein